MTGELPARDESRDDALLQRRLPCRQQRGGPDEGRRQVRRHDKVSQPQRRKQQLAEAARVEDALPAIQALQRRQRTPGIAELAVIVVLQHPGVGLGGPGEKFHPALQFVATRLLDTELRVGTNNNDINAIKNNGSVPEGYTINHFLTATNAWFLTTDVPNGLKHFVRIPLQNSMDGDFDTGNVRYKSRERYSFGVSDPLGIYGSY